MIATSEKYVGRISTLQVIWIVVSLLGFVSVSCTSPIRIDSSNQLGVTATPTSGGSNQNTTSNQFLNTVRNEVNGIGIGSSYKELSERFGNPRSKKRDGTNPCGGSKTILQYEGIGFTMDGNGETNTVVLIEITSPNWEMTPGVRAGMTIEQIRTKMGRDGMHKTDEVESLAYADGDGYLNFQFAGGKVAKITRELNMC